jgi:hypothetical protein
MGGAGPGVRRPDPRRARVESFSPDGATLATSPADVTLLWDLDPDMWRARACDIAGRNLTELERREYLPNGPASGPTCDVTWRNMSDILHVRQRPWMRLRACCRARQGGALSPRRPAPAAAHGRRRERSMSSPLPSCHREILSGGKRVRSPFAATW